MFDSSHYMQIWVMGCSLIDAYAVSPCAQGFEIVNSQLSSDDNVIGQLQFSLFFVGGAACFALPTAILILNPLDLYQRHLE